MKTKRNLTYSSGLMKIPLPASRFASKLLLTSRRDFLKKLGLAGGALAASPFAFGGTKGQSMAVDDANIDVDNANLDTRVLRDHSVVSLVSGNYASILSNDVLGTLANWEIVQYSTNLNNYSPSISNNIIFTAVLLDDLIAEQDVELTYRAIDPLHPASGPYATVNDEVDRYMTEFTINYMANNVQQSVTFKAPNSVTKKIFGWSPTQPIPYYSSYTADRVNNPTEFEDAFNNLYEILTDPQYAVQNSRLTNRNTPSPCPDPNPWYGTAALLEALSLDPMTIDQLYPTIINVQMTDFKK